jgi:hypothetical protein
MDVTHPGPTSVEGTPSVAAVVASVDDSFVQYPASMRLQKSKKEVYGIHLRPLDLLANHFLHADDNGIARDGD